MVERQFAQTGEMGRRIMAHEWENSPLGPIHDWPQSLKTAVRIILSSRYPMFVWWGDELINLYNDAFVAVLGGRHPAALGGSASEIWHEVWSEVGPQAERVLRDHEATWQEETLLLLARNDYLEETYFTYSYSPLSDDEGVVRGVFCACTEDTERVIGARRFGVLRRVADVGGYAESVAEACEGLADVFKRSDHDVAFALLYLTEPNGRRARLAVNTGVPEALAPAGVDLGDEDTPWSIAAAIAGETVRVGTTDLSSELPGGAWQAAATEALVLPVGRSANESTMGALVAGVSPRRRLDESYSRFFGLLASGVAATLRGAMAFEAERRRSEQLTELDRVKTAFFSNVSHEFRTPLTLMLGPLDDAVRDDGSLAAEDVELVRRNGFRMLKLVNTLLDFARIESGRADAAFEPVDLAAETADLASAFRSAVETEGIALRISTDPLPQPVYVDRHMWEKIVLNLISNAFKHTFEGEIAVSLEAVEDHAVLSVRDTGTGIPEDELPRIFDRFHRVKNLRGRSHEGTGIGLALARELVRMHGGSIEAESSHGKGSTFRVRIPFGSSHLPAGSIGERRDTSPVAISASAFVDEAAMWGSDARPVDVDAVAAAVGTGLRRGDTPVAVVADDNADLRSYLERLLVAGGYVVHLAREGREAFELVVEHGPDVVVSDVMMPGVDGLELVRRLRSDRRTRNVGIVLLSARAGEEARLEGIGLGADEYLVKPFSARELLVRLNGLIALRRLRAESEEKVRNLRQAAVSAVRQSAERFRRMADHAPVMVWVTNPVGEATFLSRSWYAFTGQDPDSSQGWEWTDAVHPDDRDRARAAFRKANEARTPFELEYRLHRHDGNYRWVIDAATPHLDEDGEFRGFIGSVVDITDRREAEEALRASESRFRTLANSIPQLAWMARPDGFIFWYNRRWFEYTGAEPEAMTGWGWRSVHDPMHVERVEAGYRAALAAGTPWEDTFPLRRHDGEMRWHLSRALPLRDGGGEIVMWFGTNTDITDRMEMEAALREADRRKDEFLATLAHELRNPLAPLQSGLEMLPTADGAESVERIRDVMQRQLSNMVRLVDDLLEVSRVSLGRIELRRAPIDLRSAIGSAVETVRATKAGGERDIAVTLPDEPIPVDGDATRLEQVFVNLLTNAVKYTKPDGRVEVVAAIDGPAVRASVTDDGIGIPAPMLNRIFEIFAQADRSLERSRGGLGIGLTLVRQLVDMHGGSIEAYSAGPGQGSRFTLELPLGRGDVDRPDERVEGAAAAAAAASPDRNGHRPGPLRVMVVDDNTDAAELLTELIEMEGHEVRAAHDGHRALVIGDELKPEIVFLDIGMPGLNGHDTCRLMRQRDWGRDAKIVALTGWGQARDRERSRLAGFDVHFVKPVSVDLIRKLLMRDESLLDESLLDEPLLDEPGERNRP